MENNYARNNVKNYINEEILKIKEHLKSNSDYKQELIDKIHQFKKIIALIDLVEQIDLNPLKIRDYFIIPLPQTGHFSEFRIIEDCETEDKQYWIELDIEKRLYPNDIVLRLK